MLSQKLNYSSFFFQGHAYKHMPTSTIIGSHSHNLHYKTQPLAVFRPVNLHECCYVWNAGWSMLKLPFVTYIIIRKLIVLKANKV